MTDRIGQTQTFPGRTGPAGTSAQYKLQTFAVVHSISYSISSPSAQPPLSAMESQNCVTLFEYHNARRSGRHLGGTRRLPYGWFREPP